MKIPTITITHSRLLEPALEAYADKKSWEKLPAEELEAVLDTYQKTWKKHEKRILEGISEATGLTFSEPSIDVFVSRFFRGGMSFPLIVSATIPLDAFIDVLTHELIHRVFIRHKENLDVREKLESLYPGIDDKKARTHIAVHSVLEFIYLDVLNEPHRLERDKKKCQRTESYKKAWEIVEKEGYKKILGQVFSP